MVPARMWLWPSSCCSPSPLLQFFEALGRTEIYKRVIRLIYKCLLISISRRAIVLSLKVKISDLHILRELPVGLRRIRRFISRRRGPAGVHDSVNAPGNQFGEFAFYSRNWFPGALTESCT